MIVILIFSALKLINADCVITTNRDLSPNQPLLLKPGTWPEYGNHPYYLPKNPNGDIIFTTNEEIHLHCPGSALKLNDIVIDQGHAAISCNSMRNFKIVSTNQIIPFNLIECTQPAKHIVKRTDDKCVGNNDLLLIGFPLNDGRFLTQIVVCFNPIRKMTLYTEFHLTSAILGSQIHVPRPDFDEGGSFFNLGVAVNQCYYVPKQRNTINRQLHREESSLEYIDKGSTFFSRGHLVAKGDFVFGPQQTATFYWVNVAPQWERLNNENWSELEKSVRNYASNLGKDFVVLTGVFGAASVGNIDLFLHCDDVNHIPVPKYYWKVVYEPGTQAGVAFVSVNNPFDPPEQPFCKDVCALLEWQITWERNNRNFGFSFCCEVNEFRHFVDFPEFPVVELLRKRG